MKVENLNWKRITQFQALFLLVCFTSSLAQPSSSDLFANIKSSGRVSESGEKLNSQTFSEPMVFVIQDAHANYSAQTNIAQLIEQVSKNVLQAKPDAKIGIAVEGFYGSPALDAVEAEPKDAAFNNALDFFVRQSLLTGAELPVFKKSVQAEYFGVDDSMLLEKNVELFSLTHQLAKDVKKSILDKSIQIRKEFNSDAARQLNLLYTKKDEAANNSEKYFEYIQFLLAHNGASDIQSSDLNQLFQLQKKIDAGKFEREVKSAGEKWRELSVIQLLFYPQLRTKLRIEKAMASIDLSGMYDRVPVLEYQLKDKWTSHDLKLKKAVSEYDSLSLIQKLLSLELSDKEYLSFQLKRHKLEQFVSAEFDTQASREVLKAMAAAEAFYIVAKRRDVAMVHNLFEQMKSRKLTACFLVAGGFHTEGITNYFHRHRMTQYAVLTPAINEMNRVLSKEMSVQRLAGNLGVLSSMLWKRFMAPQDGVVDSLVASAQRLRANPGASLSGVLNSRQRLVESPAVNRAASLTDLESLLPNLPTFPGDLEKAADLDPSNPVVRDLRAQGFGDEAIKRFTQNASISVSDPVTHEMIEGPVRELTGHLDTLDGTAVLVDTRQELRTSLTQEVYYADRAFVNGKPVAATPTVPYDDFMKIMAKHEETVNRPDYRPGDVGIAANYQQVIEMSNGTASYVVNEPVSFTEAQAAVKDTPYAQKALDDLRAGQVMLTRSFGGTGSRFVGSHVAEKYRIRGLLAYVAEIAGRARTAYEIILGHLRWLEKKYGGKIGMLNATSPASQSFFERWRGIHHNYGLGEGAIVNHPVGIMPSINPSMKDFQALEPGDKKGVRASITNYLKKNRQLHSQYAGHTDEQLDQLSDQEIFQFAIDLNGGQSGLFTFSDGSMRFIDPAHMCVISNAFIDGVLYQLWQQGKRILVYGNDTDLGHTINPDLLAYFMKLEAEEGVEEIALLVAKDITFKLKINGVDQTLFARKKKVMDESAQGFHFEYAAIQEGSTFNISDYEYFFSQDDKVTVRDKKNSTMIAENVSGAMEKGGVPISMNGRNAMAEAWALPKSINQSLIPDYNPASYIISIRAVFKAFGLDNPDDFARLSKQEIMDRLSRFNQKIGLYWEIKEVADPNYSYKVTLPDGREATVVLDDRGRLVRSDLGLYKGKDLVPVISRDTVKVEGSDVLEINLTEITTSDGQTVAGASKIARFNPPRFALSLSQLLGDLTWVLNTRFVTIDRDGFTNPIGYGVLKSQPHVPKYAGLAERVLGGKLDLLQNPEDPASPVLENYPLKANEVFTEEKVAANLKRGLAEIKSIYLQSESVQSARPELRQDLPSNAAAAAQFVDAWKVFLTTTAANQEPVSIVYENRLPTAEELESVVPFKHIRIILKWDPAITNPVLKQEMLVEAGIAKYEGALRGRFFTNISSSMADAALLSQIRPARFERTIVITDQVDAVSSVGYTLNAKEIDRPLPAAIVLAQVDGDIRDLPIEMQIFRQDGTRFDIVDAMSVNRILNEAIMQSRVQIAA